jgi:hypothetical protein
MPVRLDYLPAVASVDDEAASEEAAFLAFFAFLVDFLAGAEAVSVLVAEAVGADELDEDAACGAANAETANREATRPAMSLDISVPFRKVTHKGESEHLTKETEARLTALISN